MRSLSPLVVLPPRSFDRNGRYFEPLLDYFRTGELWIPEGLRKGADSCSRLFLLLICVNDLRGGVGRSRLLPNRRAARGYKDLWHKETAKVPWYERAWTKT